MRKVKVLAIILVLSMMLTGAAYALWNQNITMTTTAAMGEMDVSVLCDPCVYPLSAMPGIDDWSHFIAWGTEQQPEPYMNALSGDVTADTGGHKITVNVENLYPGAEYGVNFTVTNTGDVPVKLADVVFTPFNNGDLFAHLKGSFKFKYQAADTTILLGFPIDNGYETVPVSFDYMTTDGLGQVIVDACADIILYPGDQLLPIIGDIGDQDNVDTTMKVFVDDTISGNDFENNTVGFNVAFNWQQVQPSYAPGA